MAAKLVYILVALFNSTAGCSAANTKPLVYPADVLDTAIVAIDGSSLKCTADEYSTESEDVLRILRNRDFDVIEHSFEKQGDKIEHEFLLKQKATELLLIANVIQEDGECLGFSFGRIAQN